MPQDWNIPLDVHEPTIVKKGDFKNALQSRLHDIEAHQDLSDMLSSYFIEWSFTVVCARKVMYFSKGQKG